MQTDSIEAGAHRRARRNLATVSAIAVGLVFVAIFAAFGAPARAASTTSPVVTFASIPSPSAVAASPGQLIALSAASCSTVYAIAANGSVATFATLQTKATSCTEDAVAISPGLGNFPSGGVYVLESGLLFEIPAGGSLSPVAPSLNLTNLTGGKSGLTFDTSGNFGFTLVAVGGRTGQVVEINATNALHAVGAYGAIAEGPAIAPIGFGSLGGDLVVAHSTGSSVYAMNATGAVRSYSGFATTAEALSFTSLLSCTYATTGDAYFVADVTKNAILAVPANAFAKVAGQGLILGESGLVGLLHTNGTSVPFLRMSGNLEGASYVACPTGVTQGVDLRSRGLNGTSLNLIGYDPAAKLLLGVDLTHALTKVFLLNASTLAFDGNVSAGLDPAAVAYDPTTNTLYVANTGSNNLTVLNASGLQPLGSIPTGVGSSPVGVVYNAGNQKLYVANSGNDTLSVFSLANNVFPNKNQVLHLAGQPLGLAVDPKDGNTYVVGNIAGNGTIWEVHGFKVIATLTVGTNALAIAVNNGTGALYATCYGSNQVAVVAPGDNLTATLAIAQPISVAFDARNGLVFVDGGNGQVSVLRGVAILTSYFVGTNPGTLVYDPVSGIVYGAADVTIFGIDPRIIIGSA